MKTNEIHEIMNLARSARKLGLTFNPLFVGPPGIGKSEIVQHWCNINNLPFIDLRIAYLEAPDMIGVPKTNVVNGRNVTQHFVPEFWPTEQEIPEGVIILDEVNRGTQSMMNCLMQLLTDRKVHNYTLPKNWVIVACINPENDANDVNSMDTALRDRFEIFNVEYDKNAFVKYMKEKEWDTSIITYVENIWKFKLPEDVSNSPGSKYISNRTWSKLNSAFKANPNLHKQDKLFLEVINSVLGKNTGNDFYSFVTNLSPVLLKDLIKAPKSNLSKLREYSDPKDYKAALISITVSDIVQNSSKIKDELLVEVCLSLSADQSYSLLRELEFARKDEKLLNTLCEKNPKLLEHFKETLANEK